MPVSLRYCATFPVERGLQEIRRGSPLGSVSWNVNDVANMCGVGMTRVRNAVVLQCVCGLSVVLGAAQTSRAHPSHCEARAELRGRLAVVRTFMDKLPRVILAGPLRMFELQTHLRARPFLHDARLRFTPDRRGFEHSETGDVLTLDIRSDPMRWKGETTRGGEPKRSRAALRVGVGRALSVLTLVAAPLRARWDNPVRAELLTNGLERNGQANGSRRLVSVPRGGSSNGVVRKAPGLGTRFARAWGRFASARSERLLELVAPGRWIATVDGQPLAEVESGGVVPITAAAVADMTVLVEQGAPQRDIERRYDAAHQMGGLTYALAQWAAGRRRDVVTDRSRLAFVPPPALALGLGLFGDAVFGTPSRFVRKTSTDGPPLRDVH